MKGKKPKKLKVIVVGSTEMVENIVFKAITARTEPPSTKPQANIHLYRKSKKFYD